MKFSHEATALSGPGLPQYRGFTITIKQTILGRIPLVERSAQRINLYLTHTQHSQETDFHSSCKIRTHNPSKRAAADPRLRLGGHWERRLIWNMLPHNAAVKFLICPTQDWSCQDILCNREILLVAVTNVRVLTRLRRREQTWEYVIAFRRTPLEVAKRFQYWGIHVKGGYSRFIANVRKEYCTICSCECNSK